MSRPKTTNGPLTEKELPILFTFGDKKLPSDDCKPIDCTTFWKRLRQFVDQLRRAEGGVHG